ncbi:MAG: hypothetical protein JSR45_03895 [Proteobacteria bacterium]|nr:hypothetical protein [Pseudomonadota bacterium]
MRRGLEAGKVIETLEKLHARIAERFPSAGLGAVCADLVDTARTINARARRIAQPALFLRFGVALVLLAVVAVQASAVSQIPWARFKIAPDLAAIAQGLDAGVNLLVLAGAAIWFLLGLEQRLKRSRALKNLHELRSFAHVVDMHQLTKDPTVVLSHGPRTSTSPMREMTQFQLTRYLEYCAEMLALIGKLAALYSEYTRDPEIVAAVNDVEALATNLGRKIWQKITIMSQLDEAQAVVTPANTP